MVCAAFLGATAAMADGGGSLKDGPAPVAAGCVKGAFSGLYIGATVGYADHDDDKNDLNPALPDNNFGDSEGGFAGGLFYGYNRQCGRFVIGLESDISFQDAETEQLDPIIGCIGIGCTPSTSLTSDIDWLTTSRVRLGLVHNENTLFYVTGGLAYADVKHSVYDDQLFAPGVVDITNSDKQWGWTLGGGVETIRANGWSMRAEALYIDLGDENESFDAATVCGGVCVTEYEWEDTMWVARLGLSYRFGAREEVAAAPLK